MEGCVVNGGAATRVECGAKARGVRGMEIGGEYE